jgi:hypothetical protein
MAISYMGSGMVWGKDITRYYPKNKSKKKQNPNHKSKRNVHGCKCTSDCILNPK